MNVSACFLTCLLLAQGADAPTPETPDATTPRSAVAPPAHLDDDYQGRPSGNPTGADPTAPDPTKVAPMEDTPTEATPMGADAGDESLPPPKKTDDIRISPPVSPPAVVKPPAELDADEPPRMAHGAIRPSDLTAASLAAPLSSKLEGEATSLLAMLEGRNDRQGQQQAIHAYWKLTVAAATYYAALGERDQIDAIPVSDDPSDQALLASVQASAEARVEEALAVAIAAQGELAEANGRMADVARALPSDAPHVGTYLTRYDEIFAGRADAGRARALDQSLPRLYAAVAARTRSVAAAERAVDLAQQSYVTGRLPLDGLLARLANLSLQRQSFLAAVRAYNDDIADYAMMAAPAGISGQELSTMLIRPKTAAAAAPVRAEREASATLPIEKRSTGDERSVVEERSVISPDGFRNRQ